MGLEVPDWNESLDFHRRLGKPSVAASLANAQRLGKLLVQPRCGVGCHMAMSTLLQELERKAAPDIATITIDAHTRLKRFDVVARVTASKPETLNGYPLVTHGWRRGRELNLATAAPIQIRHGSPDPRLLFETSVAAGFTSFEGGGIGYNIPYCKDVPLRTSLDAWSVVDQLCGELATLGIIVDREFFGTLTAVLMPPSIQLAIAFIEAILATDAGVRCLSVACCQTGHIVQDIAMLRAIRTLAGRYLTAPTLEVFAVFHQFMGAFPASRQDAEALILLGSLVAKVGGATKTISKTYQEAYGVPTVDANADGIRLSKTANSDILNVLTVNEDRLEEEEAWIVEETAALIDPVLQSADLISAVCRGFESGSLDVPFSASRHAQSKVVPMRDVDGAIRIYDFGSLPIDRSLRRRHQNALKMTTTEDLFTKLEQDILWFCKKEHNETI